MIKRIIPQDFTPFKSQCSTNGHYGNETGPLGVLNFNYILKRIKEDNKRILTATGELVIFFRRKTSGEKCSCIERNREQPYRNCGICYGTGFVDGYDKILHKDINIEEELKFFNTKNIIHPYQLGILTQREIEAGEDKFLIRFTAVDTSSALQPYGIEYKEQPFSWMVVDLRLTSRDFFVRLVTNERYRIENIKRSTWRGYQTHVQFEAYLIDPSDILYKFPIEYETKIIDNTLVDDYYLFFPDYTYMNII